MTIRLNPSQARSLRIALALFEERLRQARAWLQGEDEQGILYERTLTLSPARRTEALDRIDEALAEIATLAEALALEREPEELGALIRGALSSSWADLCDTRAEKLRRYGPVDPDLAPALNPTVEHLASLALRISVLMDRSSTP